MKTKLRMDANSAMLKAAVIGVLILVLLIPVNLIESLIRERENNKETVYKDISTKWGGKQNVIGPIMIIPFTKRYVNNNGVETKTVDNIYLLPDKLNINGKLIPEERKRNIYKILVYQSDMQIDGQFSIPKFEQSDIKPEDVLWQDITMTIGIPYMQGIKNKIIFNVNGVQKEVEPGVNSNSVIYSGLTVNIPVDKHQIPDSFNFDFRLALNGTEKIRFSPIGKETHVHMTSDWPTVSFAGDFLPSERIINNQGFDAQWNIFDYNRNYSQMWIGQNNADLNTSMFGVDLKYAVDEYQMSMRSVKYAIMFIALTFVVFFLIELLSHKKIHPIQYLLVSFGLILFYTLLVALSEHIGFNPAYLISSLAIIILISIYSISVFNSKKQAGFMALYLVALYTYLYVMLQLEDLALLFGSIGLFIALAIIMYVSRKISWYKDNDDDLMNSKSDDNSIYISETPPTFNKETPENNQTNDTI